MRLFIGSSSEQRRLVEWLTSFIRQEYPGRIEPVPWTIPWPGGMYTLEHLQRIVQQTDAAILFCTADDKTWYRDTTRHEPRDNIVFEAGLFLSSHDRERAQLLLPRYQAGDPRGKVAIPSDLQGLTVNYFDWVDGPPEATGLPKTAREVCDRLAVLGPRTRTPVSLSFLEKHAGIEHVTSLVGDFFTVLNDGISELIQKTRPENIDVIVGYRVGEIRRRLDDFRNRSDARLRVCLADMWDNELLAAYRRKYFDRTEDYIRNALKESIEGVLGNCTWDHANPAKPVITAIATPPTAQYDVRVTSQRITYSYYRVDDVVVVIPLDMKKSQNPPPLAWTVSRETAPRTFERYTEEFSLVFAEARRVIRP